MKTFCGGEDILLTDSEAGLMLNFQTLFESIPGLYIVYSLDFVIVGGSDAYFQATKTKREEVVGRHLFEVFPDNPDDPNANGVQNLRASLESVLKHRKPHTMAVQKYDIRRPESEGGGFEERYWSPINSPVFEENGVMTHIIHRAEDVTEFVRVQQQRNEQRQINQVLESRTEQMEIEIYLRAQELQEVNEQLQAANEALSELDRVKTLFFSNVSHEFRTPLTLMLSPVEDALSDTKVPLPAVHRDRLELLQRNGLRLLKLVNTLLDFSRIEAGRMQASYEPTDLATLTAELASVFRSMIEQAGMQLIVDCPPLPEAIYIDRELWEKIVFNLLSNAFKFTFTGSITVRLQWADTQVELTVEDTGIGIPSEELPHLFERFHRVPGACGRTIEGSGIGLSLVQELVKLHGGNIGVSSVVDRGTCFVVSIPTGLAHLPQDRIGATRALASTSISADSFLEEALRWQPEEDGNLLSERAGEQVDNSSCVTCPSTLLPLCSSAPSARILLAEDNADMRGYVQQLLSHQYEVEAVADGVAALAVIRQQKPALVLTDVMMPRLDGFGLLRELRADPSTQEIPIILLSACAGEEARIEGLEAGADDYLTKPFSARELLARVEANLKLAQLRGDAMQQEQALRLEAETAKQTVETILSSLRDGFVTLDRDWCFTYVNDRLLEILKLPREAVMKKNLWDVFPDLVGTESYHQVHRAMNEHIAVQFEFYYPMLDCWIEHRVYPTADGIAILVADVSDRKRAQETLRESEERLRRAIAIETVGVIFFKTDGSITDTNDAFLRMSGYSREDAEQGLVRWDKMTPPEWMPHSLRAVEEFETIGRTTPYEKEYIRKDGSRWWALFAATRLNETEGVEFVVDITERKQAENALRQISAELERQLRKFDAIAAAVPDFIYTFDLSGRFTYINQPLLNLLQKTSAQAVGKNFFDLDYPIDLATRLQNQIQQVIETRQPLKDETPYTSAFGTRAYEYIFVPLLSVNGAVEAVAGVTRDITDRKQAEADLHEAHVQLESALAAGAIYTWRWKIPDDLVIVNAAFAHLFGVDPEVAATGLPIKLFVQAMHEEDRPRVVAAINQAVKTGEEYAAEYRVYTAAGEERWLAARGRVEYAPDGRPIAFPGALADITDRKRIEASLRASEQRFRDMADNAPMMVWVTDPTGYCTYLSRSWYDFSGQTEATGLEFGWLDATHPDDRESSKTIFLAANARQEAFQLEYRLRRKDGEYRTCIDAARPWFGANGEFKGYIGSVIDIDDRKLAEAALRRSEERYRTLFESIDEGFCVIEMLFDENDTPIDYRFLEINPVFEQQTGLRQAIGKTARQLVPNLEAHWIRIYGNVALTGEPARFENGSEAMNRWFDVYACRLGEPSARKVAIVFKDISDRKRIEQEREQLLQREQAARSAAETANRIKDEFLAVLSHELRSPLNPILGWSKLLQHRKLDAAKTKTALATIERNAQLQSQLIEDLLDISRILRGKLILNEMPVDLNVVIRAALETVRLAAEAKSVQIETISCNVGTVIGDAGRLQQVVWNLLSNAVKFTPQGGQITLTLTQTGTHAQLQVIDTGKGINPDFLPYVFDHFRQEDGATTRKFGGLGLGLAIVRQIVEMHGGTVAVDSPGEGQGATFTVQIPLAPQAIKVLSPERSSASTSDLSGIHILVVDDDTDSREFVTFVLEQTNAIVTTVASGFDALQAIARLIPDVIVSDIGMPDLDGYMLMRQIRTWSPEQGGRIPAVALTAYAAEFDQQQALAAGFQQHVAKPVEPEALVKAITTLIESKLD